MIRIYKEYLYDRYIAGIVPIGAGQGSSPSPADRIAGVTVSLHGYGSTTYSAANVEALERYIHELEAEIAKKSGSACRGIIRTSFGDIQIWFNY